MECHVLQNGQDSCFWRTPWKMESEQSPTLAVKRVAPWIAAVVIG